MTVIADVFTVISSHLLTRCECRIAIASETGTTFWSRSANETVHAGVVLITGKSY